MLQAKEKAQLCARVAYDAKAENIVILDLTGISQITDFFVVAGGDNPRQMKAAASLLGRDRATNEPSSQRPTFSPHLVRLTRHG